MKINYDMIKQHFSPAELRKGEFGIEREGLRVTPDGHLAMTPHPAAFGSKLTNPYITTDFSESQIEVVTPTFSSVDEAYTMLQGLCDIVEDELAEDEYFWPQSMPCNIPDDADIPIAIYEGASDASAAMAYRKGLMEKYGGKKQLISGIHLNFSFTPEFINKLHALAAPELDDQTFKDALYLKIVRQYLRYRWLVIYLTGCSTGLHKSFVSECVTHMNETQHEDSFLKKSGPSFRNSACGYKNLQPLYPDYTSIETYTRDVQDFVDRGILSAPKELYTQIRMKSKDVGDVLGSLRSEGIKYIEIRTVDLNVYDKCGIAKDDIIFIHRLMLYLLMLPESDYPNWQQDGLYNEEAIAVQGYKPGLMLHKDGKDVTFTTWALDTLNQMQKMDETLHLCSSDVILKMKIRVRHPETTYGIHLSKDIEEMGYLGFHLKQAKAYKRESQRREVTFAPAMRLDEAAQKSVKKAVTRGEKEALNVLKTL